MVLPDRAVIRIAGPDSQAFLQGVITQDVGAATTSAAAFSALLTPQGKILSEFLFLQTGDGYLLDCAAAEADALLARLNKYRLRARADLALAPDLCVGVGRNEASFLDPRLAGLGWRTIAARSAAAEAASAFDYEAKRIALGVPECGKDFGPEQVFLLDVNYDVLNAVSYRKGCFVGQEVTSRMKRKGDVRRRTLIARFDGAAPAKGSEITAAGAAIGEMLSGGRGEGLACVRIDRLDEARAAGEACFAEGRKIQLAPPAYLISPQKKGAL
jgi:hypothetical protein